MDDLLGIVIGLGVIFCLIGINKTMGEAVIIMKHKEATKQCERGAIK